MDDVWTSNMYDSSLVCLTNVARKVCKKEEKQGGVNIDMEITAC